MKSKVPEKWKEVVDYIIQTDIPETVHIHDVRVHEHKVVRLGQPTVEIEFDLVPVKGEAKKTITRVYNGMRAMRYLKKLKKYNN